MPSSQEILSGLEAIANNGRAFAILWHGAFGAVLIALGLGWRPERRLSGVLFAVPLASVSLLAWRSGNPFNGIVFIITAAALAGLAVRLPRGPLQISRPGPFAIGLLLVAFGWSYPHFLRADSWVTYLYAAPLGLIPCPTLSGTIGMALMVQGLGSRGWSLALAAIGALYGLIGWFGLGVTVDAVLLAGALALTVVALSPARIS